MHVITISTSKGGDAKSTASRELSAALGERGVRVGLVDGDPQGHAGMGLGVGRATVTASLSTYGVLAALAADEPCPIREAFVPSSAPGVEVLPAHAKLSGLDTALADTPARETLLRSALELVADRFDVVVIDLGAHQGQMWANAVVASSHLLVPAQMAEESVDGAVAIISKARKLSRMMGRELELLAVVPSRVATVGRTRESRALEEGLRAKLGDLVTRPVRVTGAPPAAFGRGVPVIQYARQSATAQDYLAIADGIASRLGLAVSPAPAATAVESPSLVAGA